MKEKKSIDIIILSYAKDEGFKDLTIQTINTLLKSEDPNEIQFNVIVVESSRSMQPYQYNNSITIYPKESFGFHKYLNIGINASNNSYVCMCNNDLIFHKGWASEILKAMENDPMLLSAHPCLPDFERNESFKGDDMQRDNYFGVLFGWCIFAKRELFNIIGPLDEKLTFWYSDYDYAYTLKKHGIKNNLIDGSIVKHLGSKSTDALNKSEMYNLTQVPRFYFSYKWHHHSYIRYKAEMLTNKIRAFLKRDRS